MEVIEIIFNDKIYKIKKDVVVYVLKRLSGKDFSKENEENIIKIMEKYCLLDEVTLKSMQD